MSSDTVFPDVSDHNNALNQKVITDWRKWSHWVSFRVCDGSYSDRNFVANTAWTENNDKEIIGKINYLVYPPSFNNATSVDTVKLFLQRVTAPHKYMRKIVAMIDVENWGRWHADMSASLNFVYHALWQGLNAARPEWQRKVIGVRRFFRWTDRRRVVGYGNASDLNTLWKSKPKGMRIVLANYSNNTPYPGEIIHQYSSHYDVPGLGYVDVNSADGLSPKQLARKLGLWKLTRSVF